MLKSSAIGAAFADANHTAITPTAKNSSNVKEETHFLEYNYNIATSNMFVQFESCSGGPSEAECAYVILVVSCLLVSCTFYPKSLEWHILKVNMQSHQG